jgi:hypothetical protein
MPETPTMEYGYKRLKLDILHAEKCEKEVTISAILYRAMLKYANDERQRADHAEEVLEMITQTAKNRLAKINEIREILDPGYFPEKGKDDGR